MKKNEVLDDSPDRPHEELSREETARREAEKAGLLARFPRTKARPVVQPSPEPMTAEPEAPQGPTAAEISDLIQNATQAHQESLERAEREFQQTLTGLLAKRAAAENREAQQIDEAMKPRLVTAIDALTAPVPEDNTAADAAHAVLCARVDPALKASRAVRRDLSLFWREYGDLLTRLLQMSKEELLRDLPMAADHAARSYGLVQRLKTMVQGTVDLYDTAMRTIERETSAINSLIDNKWPALGHYERERELAQKLHDLRTASPDTVAQLQVMVGSVTALSEAVQQQKERYRGTKEAAAEVHFENGRAIVAELKEADRRMKNDELRGAGFPARAIVEFDPYKA